MANTTLFSHTNSEGERIHIKRIEGGKFAGKLLLVIQDDPPPRGTNTEAPMLLDEDTQRWLVGSIQDIQRDASSDSVA